MRTIPFLLTETSSCVQRVFFKFNYQLTSCQLFTVLKNGGVWGTVAKLQYSIDTPSSVSAIQHNPDLLFSIRGVWKKRRKKRLLHVLSIPSAVSGVLVWTMGENEKQIMSNEHALVWRAGKVRKCYFGGEVILLRFLQNENGDLWKYISVVGALHLRQIPEIPPD